MVQAQALSSARVPGIFSDCSTEPTECFTSSTVMPPVLSCVVSFLAAKLVDVGENTPALGCQLSCCEQNQGFHCSSVGAKTTPGVLLACLSFGNSGGLQEASWGQLVSREPSGSGTFWMLREKHSSSRGEIRQNLAVALEDTGADAGVSSFRLLEQFTWGRRPGTGKMATLLGQGGRPGRCQHSLGGPR